jgi:hypothetical protein
MQALLEILAVVHEIDFRDGWSSRLLPVVFPGDRDRCGNPCGFCRRLVIETLLSCTTFVCGLRFQAVFQDQRRRDEDNNKDSDDGGDRIVYAGYELRDFEFLPR